MRLFRAAVTGAALIAIGALSRAEPAPAIHYAPAENLERVDVALIGGARHEIDLAAYVLTDWPVMQALTRAAEWNGPRRWPRGFGGRKMTSGNPMTLAGAREYSESIGQIGDGWWRQIAWARKHGIPEALGMTTREWAEKYHGYLKIPVAERREAVAELAADGMSQREIADVIGVNQATVCNDLKVDEFSSWQDGWPQAAFHRIRYRGCDRRTAAASRFNFQL